jgi:hypothetical protein
LTGLPFSRPSVLARARASAWLLAPLGVYSLLAFTQLDFVPIWDARPYADCLVAALSAPFRPSSWACCGHPTHAYMLWLASFQVISPGSAALIVVGNVVLGGGALAAFFALSRKVDPAGRGRFEAIALVTALATHPAFLAGTVFLNPDFGVVTFFLVCLWALLSERYRAAVAAGLMLVFSKETGFLLYAAAIGLWTLFFVTRGPLDPASKREILRRRIPLGIPVIAFLAYFSGRVFSSPQGGAILWEATRTTSESLPSMFLSLRLLDAKFQAALLAIFVLNFAWVSTLIIAWGAIRGVWRWVNGTASDDAGTPSRTIRLFVVALFLSTLFLLTRYDTPLNIRYFLPVFPLTLLILVVALRRLVSRPGLRIAILLFVSVLNVSSLYETRDPVSRRLFGTFRFGRHELLSMTSRTQECCGFGRDQLAYNLQFTGFHAATEAAFQVMRPSPEEIFTGEPYAMDWFPVGRLDRVTYRRTLRKEGSFEVKVMDPLELLRDPLPPERVQYLAFPNFPNTDLLLEFSRKYELVDIRRFERNGYELPVLTMRRKVQPVPVSPGDR